MSGYDFITVRRERGTTVKSYKTASRAKSTVVTIEIDVTDPYELATLLHDLHEAKHPPKPKAEPKVKKADALALPAPALQLRDMRGEER
ncbi:MAG: hypothetical protein AB7E60_01800 [Sphingobium sp.]